MSSSSSQRRQYAAKVLSPFTIFYFCCFRCVIVLLTGVMNYVFAYNHLTASSVKFAAKTCSCCNLQV